MNILKSTLIIFFSFFFLTHCNGQKWNKIEGNGNVIKTIKKVDAYDEIKLYGDINFVLISEKEGEINLEGDSNLLDNIKVETKNNILSIKTKKGVYFKYSKSNSVTVTIPVSEISKIYLSGSGNVSSNVLIKNDAFTASVTGSGDMKLNIEANSTTANVTGSGDLKLTGNTNILTCNITGSGDFNGKKLNSKNTQVKLTGSGNANVVANQSLKTKLMGSGNIKYSGKPAKLNSKVLGSGNVSRQ